MRLEKMMAVRLRRIAKAIDRRGAGPQARAAAVDDLHGMAKLMEDYSVAKDGLARELQLKLEVVFERRMRNEIDSRPIYDGENAA